MMMNLRRKKHLVSSSLFFLFSEPFLNSLDVFFPLLAACSQEQQSDL